MYDVYILQSRQSHRYYVGSTKDLTNRLDEHNRGESHSTDSGIPWVVVRVEHFESRAESMAHLSRSGFVIEALPAGSFGWYDIIHR